MAHQGPCPLASLRAVNFPKISGVGWIIHPPWSFLIPHPRPRLTLQEITVLLEVPRPSLYLPQPPSPWSSNQNSPEETLTAASQVLQNQRKRSPTPRSPAVRPTPAPSPPVWQAALPGPGTALHPSPGLGPRLVKEGGGGWGKLVLRAPTALGLGNAKPEGTYATRSPRDRRNLLPKRKTKVSPPPHLP